ncbi:MAG: [acyl-carrier-protein] S-malonyltransferase [Gammaproteobacteria bacterium TMED1]|nr:MAG: [acyl-carrier-protein] S-malonyltransferase [Gammaproteobacteria bacterium TMED1]|tara:strand:+ start:926 stop:1849 length:924 start_codon:yes stop_codon:yes gene_type:complete
MSKLAFVFPGQGSQKVGMLQGWGKELSGTFELASEVLGYDLWKLIQDGPVERLNQTEYTQPAVLTSSLAMWFIAKERGAAPDLVAGHSLGEYAALVAAEVVSFEVAVSLVQKRGQLMQSAVPIGKGGMAAILGLEDENVVEICRTCAGADILEAANFNSPGQVVIAGHTEAINRALEACNAAGAKRAIVLPVSAPFHCRLMEPAAAEMATILNDTCLSEPTIGLLQNVDAHYARTTEHIRANLVAQMSKAVLWTPIVQHMVKDGVDVIVECGPGSVLSGLNRRIDKSVSTLGISSEKEMGAVMERII